MFWCIIDIEHFVLCQCLCLLFCGCQIVCLIVLLLVLRIPDSIGRDIEKACQSIYPLHDVNIRKVKVLKKPKFDLGKLMEMHGEGSSSTTTTETGTKIEREGFEPPVQESV